MNILIISQNYYPEVGSHANRITNLSLLLDKKGYKVDVLTSEPSYPHKELYNSLSYWEDGKKQLEQSKVKVIRLSNPTKERSAHKLKRLFYYFSFFLRSLWFVLSSHKKYDVVFVTSPQLFTGITGIVAKYKYKAKFIFDIRDLWPESVKHVGIYKQKDITLRLAYKLEKYILGRANAILVNSKGFLPYLKDKKVIDKVYYMPNSISDEELIRNINLKKSKSQIENSLSIVYAGNIGLAQDLRVLVKLADKLKDRKNISFTIIGTGVQENKLKEEIKKQGLNNIIFKGVLPRKDTLKEIGKHDLAFLHLKKEEVFKTVIPGKLIDYMSMGMPILAGVEGEAQRVINEAGCGYTFKPGDYNSMAERIISIAKEGKSNYSSMGIKGVDYIKENFIWEKNIKIFEEIVYKLTSRKTIVEKKQIKYI